MSRKRKGHADKTTGLRVSRKSGERVRLTIGDTMIWVAIANVIQDRVVLAFSAPLAVEIFREECLPCEQ